MSLDTGYLTKVVRPNLLETIFLKFVTTFWKYFCVCVCVRARVRVRTCVCIQMNDFILIR